MNQKLRTTIIDMLIATVLVIAIGLLMNWLIGTAHVYAGLVIIPIVWIALRYGSEAGIIVGALSGLILGLILFGFSSFMQAVLYHLVPLSLAGFAGVFARNTHKTLNNKRYNSTYLNIATGSLLSTLVLYLISFWLVPLILNETSLFDIRTLNYWMSLLITWVITSVILILLARFLPRVIIPKRSKFLSRKETSSLLND